ncbi:zinc finger BED domain-containing protein 4-like [Haliotis rubra]|uniref:zinc finger BED domain-containing protein 4-like n=1 Tax=Haliotis rubra TaxID=36100 RepID=UPI001EE597A3|nr:zinc finger BED domain-containing protein 4-like [Haliotis rubra]
MNCLEPKYTLPSRATLSRKVIPDLYEKVKEVKAGLKASHSVALTTDGWTSRATQSYITITAHFIDEEWELKNKVLQTRQMFDSHTGVNIADVLKQAIDDWELKRPHGQQPITSDSAANVCLAVDIAEMTPHIRCFAHIINLAAQQALHINEVQCLLGRVRRIVTFFHKSSTANYQLELKQKLLQLPNHLLINKVKTRWNSAYDMIERYLEQQPAVMAALMSPNIKREKDLDTLSSDDITLAEHFIKVLGPLKTITTILCESNIPTLSMVQSSALPQPTREAGGPRISL